MDKLDDLENRSRRNNLIVFNFPEGEENSAGSGSSCIQFISGFISSLDPNLHFQIERAHRTPPGPAPLPDRSGKIKDRPIHVCFTSFQERDKVRKACIAAFKTGKKFKERKLFVSEDFSLRVQARRKALLPTLKKLQHEGKKAFFTYPATIRYVQDNRLHVYKPDN